MPENVKMIMCSFPTARTEKIIHSMRQSKLDFKAKKDPFPKSDQSKEIDQPHISCESKITKTDDKEAAIQILKAFDLDSRVI